jgi:L-threonylcarbamoyladenylate synthase
MVIVKVSAAQQKEAILFACKVLRRGGVIAFPTETTYGLGCDPRNEKAVERIFQMKGRDPHKPVLLVCSSFVQAQKMGVFSVGAKKLAKEHWPGPLTIVLPVSVQAKQKVSKLVISARGEIAVRYSSSMFVQILTKTYGFPIVATSANLSGQSECRSGRAILRLFQDRKEKPDLIIDVGSLPRRKLSTIARVHEDGRIDVVRQGGVRI